MAFFAGTTLAIDVGLFMTARAQAQNAADAGALAGATAFVYNSFNDRTAGGPAVQSAINTAKQNKVVGGDVSIDPADVTFPLGPTGRNDRVQVWVYRTTARGNNIPTLIGPVFGVNDFDIVATATAEAAPANAMTCVKPFTIPDKWIENNDSALDDRQHVRPLRQQRQDHSERRCLHPAKRQPHRRGRRPTPGRCSSCAPEQATTSSRSFYYSWKMPGGTGGDFYRDNIAGCNPTTIADEHPDGPGAGQHGRPHDAGYPDLLDAGPERPLGQPAEARRQRRSARARACSRFRCTTRMSTRTAKQNGRTRGPGLEELDRVLSSRARTATNVSRPHRSDSGVIDDNAGPAPEGVFPRAIRLVR